MGKVYIKSEHLQIAEPFMEKYYDFHATMFVDEMKHCVEDSGINYWKKEDDIFTIDYDESFREHKDLCFAVSTPYKNEISEQFSDYFIFQDSDSEEEENITENDMVKTWEKN